MRKQYHLLNKKHNRASQSGLAVVIALGITFLLLGLGIAFVTTSIVEKKLSNNYEDVSLARMTAYSALNRALAIMDTRGMNHAMGDISSIDSGDTNGNSTEELAELKDQIETTINSTAYTLASSNPSPDAKAYPQDTEWIYITSGGDASTNKYIARMAFAVIPDTGRLDPSASVDSGKYSSFASTEGNVGIGADGAEVTMIDSSGNPVIGRPGVNINEIFLNTIDPNWETYWERISSTNAVPPGNLALGERWKDEGELISNGMQITNPETNMDVDTIRKIFTTDEPAIPEAFWIDNNNNNVKTPNELYHRFNLSRSQSYWDSITLSQIANAIPISVTDTINGSSGNYLPWLNNWKYNGGMTSVDAAKNQIIANLIDYNDSNDTPTTDYTGSNIPTYFGLEKVPYINEVNLKISAKLTKNTSTGGGGGKGKGKGGGGGSKKTDNTWDYEISIDNIKVELVNMYDDIKVSPIARLSLVVSYRINNGEVLSQKINLTNQKTQKYNFSGKGYLTNQIFSSGATGILGTTTNTYDLNTISLDTMVDTMILTLCEEPNNGKYYDYSLIKNNNTSWKTIPDLVSGETKTFYLNYEVGDPRQNLNPSDWTETFSQDVENMSVGKNKVFPTSFTGVDTDPEIATEPYDISTAYIRNSPMRSPWELGFIHRAKAFQTINLKKYNNTEKNYLNSGGDKYTEGDANILDQIKMSDDYSQYGKVNINSDIDAVLWPLFAKIRVGSNPNTPGELTNSQVTTSGAKEIATIVKSSNPFPTRASMLSNPTVSDKFTSILPDAQKTDRTQEEIIGKFINLSDASPGNIFYIVAIGQAIRDLKDIKTTRSGQNSSSEYLQYNHGIDEVLATVKIYAIVKRNPVTNKFEILREQYINE